ncbi:MAG: enoyl-CoA hydratase [Candidatus Lokiarchaeota archaeon]|nr:enoyl-CoA hydratase [Candidatus Lokiarchaeota archaeon]
MNVDEFKDIIWDKDENGIVTVTLNIPKRKNALSNVTFLELYYAAEALKKDKTARAMIITGAKDPNSSDPKKEAFSSGGYFNMAFLKTIDPELMKEIEIADIAQKKACLKFWDLDKPVIAAVNGLAIGAGYTFAIACSDLIYMSEYAWVRFGFVHLGILPEFATTYIIPRLVGFHKAKELFYFGATLTAQETVDLGLANEVVPHDKLLSYCKEKASLLIPPKAAGLGVRLQKRAMHKPLVEALSNALDAENKGLGKATTTYDFSEAMNARKEKREPVFKGK